MNKSSLQSYNFLGIRVHAFTKADLLDVIEATVNSGRMNNILGNHNLHSLYLVQRVASMQQFYVHNLFTYVDGMSLILLAKLFGVPLRQSHRVPALDWFEEFLKMAEQESWRIYFLGGKPEVANDVPNCFRAAYPRLQIRSHHGYDAFTSTTTVYAEISEFEPHVLIVGMGMPLQERWVVESLSRIKVNLIATTGATMDYYLGAQTPAPRWLGRKGLEWLYRFLHDPKRLLFRYLFEPVMLLPAVYREWYKGNKINAADISGE